ncbi:MAG: hypothetical protein ABR987_09640 [Terracidiphilus sp.]|jgi:hypothetical protein
MNDSLIDRIRNAEEAARGLLLTAVQIREEVERLPLEDQALRAELSESAEEFENQANGLAVHLERWRKQIN